MAPRKLSDADKSTIVDLYKQPGQTTSTLAEQYGVSNSTISRILKMSIPSDEYRELVSTKRMGGGTDKASANKRRQTKTDGKPAAKSTSEKGRQRRRRIPSNNDEAVNLISEAAATATDGEFVSDAAARSTVEAPKLKTAAEKEADQENAKPSKRRRRRKTTAQKAVGKNAEQTEQDEQLALLAAEEQISPPPSVEADNDEEDDDDDLLGLDETLGDDFGDDDDELDEEDDDDELDDDEMATPKPKLQVKTAMQIMPLGEAVLPKPCYLVIDMRSELITRPLVEFADLGKVPSEEERAKTLPVFDNHRVARRFSRNKQRVIKVPDGALITRTSPYLAAKGITRLLVDGQVFDLAGADT